jgi:hypothetical protein
MRESARTPLVSAACGFAFAGLLDSIRRIGIAMLAMGSLLVAMPAIVDGASATYEYLRCERQSHRRHQHAASPGHDTADGARHANLQQSHDDLGHRELDCCDR